MTKQQHPLDILFWETYNALKREDGTVSEAALKQGLVATGKLPTADAAVSMITDIINEGGLTRAGCDVLVKNPSVLL